jgi:hypothetical protein
VPFNKWLSYNVFGILDLYLILRIGKFLVEKIYNWIIFFLISNININILVLDSTIYQLVSSSELCTLRNMYFSAWIYETRFAFGVNCLNRQTSTLETRHVSFPLQEFRSISTTRQIVSSLLFSCSCILGWYLVSCMYCLIVSTFPIKMQIQINKLYLQQNKISVSLRKQSLSSCF